MFVASANMYYSGWTPSTFTSSRAERAKQKAARPEDFMDEEDLQELKDSRVLVDTTEEMDFSGGTKVGNDDSEQECDDRLYFITRPI